MPDNAEESFVQKTAKKAKKHAKKTGVTAALSTIVLGLQMFGALGPLICSIPFINQEKCLEAAARSSTVARNLHMVEGGLVLEGGAPMMVETVGDDHD